MSTQSEIFVELHCVPKKPGTHIMANNFHKHRPI